MGKRTRGEEARDSPVWTLWRGEVGKVISDVDRAVRSSLSSPTRRRSAPVPALRGIFSPALVSATRDSAPRPGLLPWRRELFQELWKASTAWLIIISLCFSPFISTGFGFATSGQVSDQLRSSSFGFLPERVPYPPISCLLGGASSRHQYRSGSRVEVSGFMESMLFFFQSWKLGTCERLLRCR